MVAGLEQFPPSRAGAALPAPAPSPPQLPVLPAGADPVASPTAGGERRVPGLKRVHTHCERNLSVSGGLCTPVCVRVTISAGDESPAVFSQHLLPFLEGTWRCRRCRVLGSPGSPRTQRVPPDAKAGCASCCMGRMLLVGAACVSQDIPTFLQPVAPDIPGSSQPFHGLSFMHRPRSSWALCPPALFFCCPHSPSLF